MDIIFFLLSLLINLVHPCRIKEFVGMVLYCSRLVRGYAL